MFSPIRGIEHAQSYFQKTFKLQKHFPIIKKTDKQEIQKAIKQAKRIPEKQGGASSEELADLYAEQITSDGESKKLERLDTFMKITAQSTDIQEDVEQHKLKDYLLRP